MLNRVWLVSHKKSDYFISYNGVRQGENWSLLLFALYSNDGLYLRKISQYAPIYEENNL